MVLVSEGDALEICFVGAWPGLLEDVNAKTSRWLAGIVKGIGPCRLRDAFRHGGASDRVTVFRVGGQDPTPQYVGEVTVGLNPFGLTYVR